MKKLMLGSAMALGFALAMAPGVSGAKTKTAPKPGATVQNPVTDEPTNGGCNNDWGDGDTGGCTVGGDGGGGGGYGGGGAGGATCYNWVGSNASCEASALGYFYKSCNYNCH